MKNLKQKIMPILPTALLMLSAGLIGVSGGYAAGRHSAEIHFAEAHTALPLLAAEDSTVPIQLPDTQTDTSSEADRDAIYIVGIQGDYIAVFYNDQTRTLKERTARAVSSLPSGEIQRLIKGISVYSEEELLKILQDYGS